MSRLRRVAKGLINIRRFPEIFKCILITPQWGKMIAAYIGLWPLSYPFDFRTRSDQSIRLHTFHDLITVWIIFCREEYRVDPKSKVIVDVGANIGAFSVYACGKAPEAKVIAIEPFPDTIQSFIFNIAANHLEDSVKLVTKGLSAHGGERRMPVDPSIPSQSLGLLPEDAESGLTISTISLDTFWREEKLDKIDLLKMDIEGGEHEVLPITSKELFSRIENLTFEYHPNGSRHRMFELLRTMGFHLVYDLRNYENSGTAWFSRTVT